MIQKLTMAFIRSEKPFEKRIAILPQDLAYVKNCDQLYFEMGYGSDFDIDDQEYEKMGCHVVTKAIALQQDILCDTKIGDASYLDKVEDHKIIIGWIHAGADRHVTDIVLKKKFTCYAWEDFYENERHVFWENNRIAGAGGVLHALQYTGFLPHGMHAGIIGRGDTAIGAFSILQSLGAMVRQYNRKQEALFIKELPSLDLIVMAVRWDTSRNDYLISSESRKLMKKGAVIIDISDDEDGAIEKSRSTTMKDPIYELDNIKIYSVCNVPSIFYKTATIGISKVMSTYIDDLIEQKENEIIQKSLIIHDGVIIDERIIAQQHR